MLYIDNAKKRFSTVKEALDKSSLNSEFYSIFESIIPDKVDADTLILTLKIVLQDLEREEKNIFSLLSLIPKAVIRCTPPEFYKEFRKKYNNEILGLTQEELPDVDYGYTEVSPEVIDISNKDRNEVLAALYNASIPVGMGFAQYNPMPWTKETAKMYFEQFGQADSTGAIVVKWIMGRPLNCTFADNLVYIAGYNIYNEAGLAQRAIATCPNKEEQKGPEENPTLIKQ